MLLHWFSSIEIEQKYTEIMKSAGRLTINDKVSHAFYTSQDQICILHNP